MSITINKTTTTVITVYSWRETGKTDVVHYFQEIDEIDQEKLITLTFIFNLIWAGVKKMGPYLIFGSCLGVLMVGPGAVYAKNISEEVAKTVEKKLSQGPKGPKFGEPGSGVKIIIPENRINKAFNKANKGVGRKLTESDFKLFKFVLNKIKGLVGFINFTNLRNSTRVTNVTPVLAPVLKPLSFRTNFEPSFQKILNEYNEIEKRLKICNPNSQPISPIIFFLWYFLNTLNILIPSISKRIESLAKMVRARGGFDALKAIAKKGKKGKRKTKKKKTVLSKLKKFAAVLIHYINTPVMSSPYTLIFVMILSSIIIFNLLHYLDSKFPFPKTIDSKELQIYEKRSVLNMIFLFCFMTIATLVCPLELTLEMPFELAL